MRNPSSAHLTDCPTCSLHKLGFTLVEILTVIAIISVLLTAGAIGLGNLTAGKGTSTAIANCEGLFDEARTIAITKRCKAKVLVDIDDPSNSNYLRRVVIAHQEINDDGSVEEDSWVISNRGYTIPNGTFFSQVYSSKNGGGKLDVETLSTGVPSAYRGDYLSYEFNGEGIFTDPGSSFLIAAGVRPKNGEPRITNEAERDFAGFVIWRNGRTSAFRSPEQMELPQQITNF